MTRTTIAGLVAWLLTITPATAGEIAFLAHADGFWQVHTMDAAGTNIDRVTTSPYDKLKLSWYPGGRHLLVNGSQGIIVKVDTHTHKETTIELPMPDIADAVISPDGNTIAFSHSGAAPVDRNDLWLVDQHGGGLQRLTRMQGLQHEPAWSTDGRTLFFLSGPIGPGKRHHDLFSLQLVDRSMTQLTAASGYHFDIAANINNTLAYSTDRSGNYDIWMQQTGEKPRRLTRHPSVDAKPSWAPDGSALVFESHRGGRSNIWHLDLASGALRRLTDHPVGARGPVWFSGRQP